MIAARSVPRPLIAALALFVLAAASLARPTCAAACSCFETVTVEDALRDSAVVASGYVNDFGDGPVFSVVDWFHGAGPTDTLRIERRDPAACGIELAGTGEYLLLAATRNGDVLAPSACLPHAEMGTPEGDALLATVHRVFADEAPVVPACWPTRSLAAFVEDWRTLNRDNDAPEDDVTPVVVVGAVTENLGMVDDAGSVSYRFAVEQWFPGPEGFSEVGLRVMSTPEYGTATLEIGQRVVIAGGMQGDAIGFAECLPHADPDTPEGQQLLAEASEILGEPVIPAPDRRLPVSGGSGLAIAMALQLIFMTPLWIVLLALLVIVPVGVAVAVRRRRGTPAREPDPESQL